MGAAEKFLTEAEKSPQGRSRLRYRLYQDQDCDGDVNVFRYATLAVFTARRRRGGKMPL